jgi:hypothetical protein
MSPITTGRIAFAAAAIAALVGAASCKKPESKLCPTGILCPPGWECAAKTAQCIQGLCGNGVKDPGEACDDGGTNDLDVGLDGTRCSADCKSDQTCGNGILDTATGEVCDCKRDETGAIVKCDPAWATSCSADCKSTGVCGNGFVDSGEACDGDGAGHPGETATCNKDCTARRCGDGEVNATALEQCDRNGDGVAGADGQSATCNYDCTLSRCGDGKKNPLAVPPEQCDDGDSGGNGWNANCLPNCTLNACGDGHLNKSKGLDGKQIEDCDSGPADATPKVDCQYGANATSCTLCSVCKSVAGTPHYCGDNHTDSPNEKCDLGSANVDNPYDPTKCPYGNAACSLCSRDCQTLKTYAGPFCGDGTKNTGLLSNGTSFTEDCDNVDSMACGTCGSGGTANQCTYVNKKSAVGWITVNATDGLAGVTVTVTDGILNTPLTFEYAVAADIQPDGKLADGNLGIAIVAGDLHATAVNTDNVIGPAFPKITGDVMNDHQVRLTNDNQGILGNQPIEVTNNDLNAISVSPMIDGVGCWTGQRCNENRDCVSNTCYSSNHQCK